MTYRRINSQPAHGVIVVRIIAALHRLFRMLTTTNLQPATIETGKKMKPKILVASLCIFAAPAIAQSPSAPTKQSTAPLPTLSMPTPVTASVPSSSSASEQIGRAHV